MDTDNMTKEMWRTEYYLMQRRWDATRKKLELHIAANARRREIRRTLDAAFHEEIKKLRGEIYALRGICKWTR